MEGEPLLDMQAQNQSLRHAQLPVQATLILCHPEVEETTLEYETAAARIKLHQATTRKDLVDPGVSRGFTV